MRTWKEVRLFRGSLVLLACGLSVAGCSASLNQNSNYAACLSESESCITLDLGNQGLTGTIPVLELQALTKLQQLHLNLNSLTGTLPTQLEALTDLTLINVAGNPGLCGSVPRALAKAATALITGTSLDGSCDSVPGKQKTPKLPGILHASAWHSIASR
ncbi:hypothetical protein CYMTET_25108, partial [Cymbomonas tetramitiformis]